MGVVGTWQAAMHQAANEFVTKVLQNKTEDSDVRRDIARRRAGQGRKRGRRFAASDFRVGSRPPNVTADETKPYKGRGRLQGTGTRAHSNTPSPLGPVQKLLGPENAPVGRSAGQLVSCQSGALVRS